MLVVGRYVLFYSSNQTVQNLVGQVGDLAAQLGSPFSFRLDNGVELHSSEIKGITAKNAFVEFKTVSESVYTFMIVNR